MFAKNYFPTWIFNKLWQALCNEIFILPRYTELLHKETKMLRPNFIFNFILPQEERNTLYSNQSCQWNTDRTIFPRQCQCVVTKMWMKPGGEVLRRKPSLASACQVWHEDEVGQVASSGKVRWSVSSPTPSDNIHYPKHSLIHLEKNIYLIIGCKVLGL